jgi:signal transduction histidine kinase
VLLTGVDLPNNQPVPPDPVARALYLLAVSGIISAALALFWALGVAARTRRALIAERVERLESDRVRLSAELRVAQETERNRITREMHDAIGHSLTVVIAQSDGARYALAHDPDAASRALAVINRSARSALDDVNELLTVLRGASEGPAVMGIADISELVANMNESGLQVDLAHDGERRDLSKAQELAVYRVLQEALTNALKHGGHGTRVVVRLRWGQSRLEIETVTTEPGAGGAGSGGGTGSGILGMTERVRLLGGSLEARPRDGAPGFVVRAWLPYTLPTNLPTNLPGTPGGEQ